MKTNKKTENFINSLSPVKKRIAEKLNAGISPEKAAKQISKENGSSLANATAWTTMVVNAAEQKKIVFNEQPIQEQEEKATYSHDPEKDTSKVAIQNRIIEEIKHSKIRSGLVLTLSWIKCIVEGQIYANFPKLQFLSCELHRPTFLKLENEIKTRGLKYMLEPLRCEIGRIIRISAKDTYSHLLLDYCGHLNSFKEEIGIAIKNKIVQKDGIIWITVVARSGKGFKGFDTKQELRNLVELSGGKDYKVEHIVNYRDTDKAPMTTAIIRRIK